MKKFLLFSLLLIQLSLKASFALPEEFYVTQHWFSTTSTFDISTPTEKLGIVDRKFWSLRCEYNFYDVSSAHLAKARMRWLTFGAVFDVTDHMDLPIGTVNERFFSFFPKFEIVSPKNEVLAIASMNFWNTKYTVTDPVTQQEMAILSRPYFRFKDNWTAKITNPALFASKNIDPRLFIIVMAFQTDCDYWKKNQSSSSSTLFSGASATLAQPEEQDLSISEEDLKNAIQKIEGLIQEEMTEDQYLQLINALLDQDYLTDGEREALVTFIEATQKN